MAEDTGKAIDAAESKDDPLEVQKNETLMFFLKMTREFATTDMEINRHLEKFLGALAAHAEKNPDAVFSGGGVDDIVAALKPGCGCKDIKGRDIVGGAIGLDDILKAILEFIATEKKFVIAILLLVFCPLKACDCLCDYIKQ